MEGILLGGDDDEAQVGDVADQEIRFHRVVAAVEVRGDAALEALGLADVDDGAVPVDVEIHARFLGQCEDFLAQFRGWAVVAQVVAAAIVGYFDGYVSMLVDAASAAHQQLPALVDLLFFRGKIAHTLLTPQALKFLYSVACRDAPWRIPASG